MAADSRSCHQDGDRQEEGASDCKLLAQASWVQCVCSTSVMLALLQVIKGAVEVQVALIDQSVYPATVSQPLHDASAEPEREHAISGSLASSHASVLG